MAEGLFKSSVPLEDGEIKKTPGYKPSGDAPPYAPPSNEVYVKHYAGTKIWYNIIYVDSFSIRRIFESSITSGTIKEFKGMLIERIDRCKKIMEIDPSAELEGHVLKEAEFILKHLKENCVNILANRYDDEDFVGPEAIDHDIGHYLMTDKNQVRKEFTIQEIAKDLFEAFWKDYGVTVKYNGMTLEVNKDLCGEPGEFFNSIVWGILSSSFGLSQSISEFNMGRGYLEDLEHDIVAFYNKNEESLSGIKLKPLDFTLYRGLLVKDRATTKELNLIDQLFEAKIISDKYDFYEENINSISIIPKAGALPNMNKAILPWIKSMEEQIKQGIDGLVGKVLILW